MSIVVVGANHRTAPLELLERMSVRGDALPKMLHHLSSGDYSSEAVVLATCNRTEVYLVAERFHGAFGEVRNFFSDLTYLPPDRFADSLYVHYDEQAVSHLFEVAAGLDSAVPGEHEILGQVRTAWEVARSEDSAHRSLNLLFRHALVAGKRARSETRIGEHTTSVSQAAVSMATQHLASQRRGSLVGSKVLVVGAGTMGRRIARFLNDAPVGELVLANRSPERAAMLAAEIDVPTRLISLDEMGPHIEDADVLFSATGSDHPVIGGRSVALDDCGIPGGEAARAIARRAGSPLLAIDVAVPRDIDPALGELDGIDLLDMTAVADVTDNALAERHREADSVRRIVAEEVRRYFAASSAREVAPLVAGIHRRGEEIRSAELERFSTVVESLDESQRSMLEAITKGIVAKMLHEPTVRLKDAAGSSRGDRLGASLAELFDL